MKNLCVVLVMILSFLSFGSELFPFGSFIQNKKSHEKIIAHCHWLWDDKTQGQMTCLDLRIHLVDKNFQEIRELTKIRSKEFSWDNNLPGTDEYVRTPDDFKGSMVQKMVKHDFTGNNIYCALIGKVFYPMKIRSKSRRFYNAINRLITKKDAKKISFKNSDFQFALDVLEQ